MNPSPRQYLKDAELDRQLSEKGFVVMDFLGTEEVAALTKTFNDSHTEETVPFYATAHHQNTDFRKKMSAAISEKLQPHFDKTFENCNLLGASFIVKSKSEQSLLQPHQDWNIVDETKFRSFNIWIPLVDLNENNGAIEILPKSHNWLRGYRHSSINCAYSNVHHLVWENMKPPYLKAGQALIYGHALLHASKANTSDQKRIALASGIIPSEAQMYFYWNNNGTVEQYESNTAFFMTENIFEGPGPLKKIGNMTYDFPSVNEAQFCRLAEIEPPQETPNIEKTEPAQNEETPLSFWEIYTPLNIAKEIGSRFRLGK
ncbi:MAG: phytanoyl-CoA dioxygenase family protein [Flavobacteriales bacterium]|nr:phytanoyl-CoA dioxygenase family protein [Flavobacteriales bacterium]